MMPGMMRKLKISVRAERGWNACDAAAACGNVLLHVLIKVDGVQNHAVCVCDRFEGVPDSEGFSCPMSPRDGTRSVRCVFTSVALVLGQLINACQSS
jgi:hypothetical protein